MKMFSVLRNNNDSTTISTSIAGDSFDVTKSGKLRIRRGGEVVAMFSSGNWVFINTEQPATAAT